jgi:hypothetical protein
MEESVAGLSEAADSLGEVSTLVMVNRFDLRIANSLRVLLSFCSSEAVMMWTSSRADAGSEKFFVQRQENTVFLI